MKQINDIYLLSFFDSFLVTVINQLSCRNGFLSMILEKMVPKYRKKTWEIYLPPLSVGQTWNLIIPFHHLPIVTNLQLSVRSYQLSFALTCRFSIPGSNNNLSFTVLQGLVHDWTYVFILNINLSLCYLITFLRINVTFC